MARPPRDPSLISWPWGSSPSGSGGPSSAVGLTTLPIVSSHAESAAMPIIIIIIIIIRLINFIIIVIVINYDLIRFFRFS